MSDHDTQQETSEAADEARLRVVIREMGRYRPEAFEFLHAGLDFTVQRIHGPIEPQVEDLAKRLDADEIDPADLHEYLARGRVPKEIRHCIEEIGGSDAALRKLNRHVDGRALCWGLRDMALERWGLMASEVLRRWGISETRDIGRMVFGLVESSLMKKQPTDRLKDFEDVFAFEDAFDRSFKIGPKSETA